MQECNTTLLYLDSNFENRINMSTSGSLNNGQRRFRSYLSYAFSSILFDIVAYSMSGKLYAFVTGHETILFFFPSLMISWTNFYLRLYGYAPYAINVVSVLILALPVVTFLAGVFLHKISERKFRKRKNANFPDSLFQ